MLRFGCLRQGDVYITLRMTEGGPCPGFVLTPVPQGSGYVWTAHAGRVVDTGTTFLTLKDGCEVAVGSSLVLAVKSALDHLAVSHFPLRAGLLSWIDRDPDGSELRRALSNHYSTFRTNLITLAVRGWAEGADPPPARPACRGPRAIGRFRF